MPSQITGSNGTTNQYNISKITNYSIIENNDSAIPYYQSDTGGVNVEYIAPVETCSQSIQILEQGMSDLCTYSIPSNSNVGFFDEYRLRLNSEDLGQRRPISCLRRANTMDGNIDFRSTNFGFSSGEFEETKLRDICARDARQLGYLVGDELELVKARSHRSVIHNMPDRITSSFQDKYGQSDPSNKKTYLQLGVRVPTKEHVSEIVGKQGSKIKQIREKTGALITTPGEHEDHVFIIEAPPRTALHVAQILKSRAEDISVSRNQENQRRSSCPNSSIGANHGNRHHIKSSAIVGGIVQPNSKIILASGRIQVPKLIVGRIIGTQGSIITTIQRDTGTEIRSPPKEVGKPKHSMADFDILVYQTVNLIDVNEARQRVDNARQLIAHVAMFQLEKVRAEEAPYSNYQVQATKSLLNSKVNGNDGSNANVTKDKKVPTKSSNKERMSTEQMKSYDWIWQDIEQLEDVPAREVVDRILEESKKKTKTRSEPSIYDHNVLSIGESESFSNAVSNLRRPRHSLPEAKVAATAGFGLDLFNRSNLQTILSYPVNDDLILREYDSRCRSSAPDTGFNCQESQKSRPDNIFERDIFNFQSRDFANNSDYSNVNCFSKGPISMSNAPDRIINDQTFGNEFTTSPTYYNPFMTESNSCWPYKPSQLTPIKTYADSVKPGSAVIPTSNNITPSYHGTIGDHLKKPNTYKS